MTGSPRRRIAFQGPLCRCFILFVLAAGVAATAQSGRPQQPSEPNLSAMERRLDAIQAQQMLILDKLNELEANLTASGSHTAAKPDGTTDITNEAFMGAATANVAIIEYGDYECPYCAEFQRNTFPELFNRYIKPGKVRFYYRDLPLPAHPHAILAARASHCAADQSKYWEMHDALFENQSALSQRKLVSIARALHLETAEFVNCLSSNKFSKEMSASTNQAHRLGVTATPTFIIGSLEDTGSTLHVDNNVVGAVPFQELEGNLDTLLSDGEEKRQPGGATRQDRAEGK